MFARLKRWLLEWLLIFVVLLLFIGSWIIPSECVFWIVAGLFYLFHKQIRALVEMVKRPKADQAT
jgi:hypothetical protein